MGATEEDVMGDWNNIPRRVTVNSFTSTNQKLLTFTIVNTCIGSTPFLMAMSLKQCARAPFLIHWYGEVSCL
jgi:hypothetical protein